MRNTRLTAVPDSEMSEVSAPAPSGDPNPILGILLLTLKTLSQKTLIALAEIADLLVIASAFVVWLRIIAEPSEYQLIGAGLYGAFALMAVWLRNRDAR